MTKKAQNIVFIGLGVMGMPMARHLARQLNQQNQDSKQQTEYSTPASLHIYNRSPEKSKAFIQQYSHDFPHLKINPLLTLADLKKKPN